MGNILSKWTTATCFQITAFLGLTCFLSRHSDGGSTVYLFAARNACILSVSFELTELDWDAVSDYRTVSAHVAFSTPVTLLNLLWRSFLLDPDFRNKAHVNYRKQLPKCARKISTAFTDLEL